MLLTAERTFKNYVKCDKSIEISCTEYLGDGGCMYAVCPIILVKGSIEVDEIANTANTDPFKGD